MVEGIALKALGEEAPHQLGRGEGGALLCRAVHCPPVISVQGGFEILQRPMCCSPALRWVRLQTSDHPLP